MSTYPLTRAKLRLVPEVLLHNQTSRIRRLPCVSATMLETIRRRMAGLRVGM